MTRSRWSCSRQCSLHTAAVTGQSGPGAAGSAAATAWALLNAPAQPRDGLNQMERRGQDAARQRRQHPEAIGERARVPPRHCLGDR